MFGCVEGDEALIQNTIMKWPDVWAFPSYSTQYTGTLVGSLRSGKVTNCHSVGGEVYTRIAYGGGLIGSNSQGEIIDCTSSTTVRGGILYIGGLVGYSAGIIARCSSSSGYISANSSTTGGLVGVNNGLISESYSTARVVGGSGLVGQNHNSGIISQCYALGEVSGNVNIEGFVGLNSGSIKNCYARGNVYIQGPSDQNICAGGFAGLNKSYIQYCYSTGKVGDATRIGGGFLGCQGSYPSGIVQNCYWDIETSEITTSAGGAGLSSDAMKMMISYKGFACEPAWTIEEGVDYPHLIWENEPGEVIYPVWYAGGVGTEEDPYLIETAEQLNAIDTIPCDLTKHFKLISNLDLSGYTGAEFNLIGDYNNRFSGVFMTFPPKFEIAMLPVRVRLRDIKIQVGLRDIAIKLRLKIAEFNQPFRETLLSEELLGATKRQWF